MGRLRLVGILFLICLLWTPSFGQTSGLFKTGNAKLDKILSSYSLSKAIAVENLAVVTVVSTQQEKARDDYLSLDEALKKKLLTIKEISKGGRVPILKVVSHSDRPIFLPFGAIVTGGKQDRMLREDVVLSPKKSKKLSVYCIEQGRWRPGVSKGEFLGSTQVAAQSMKSLSASKATQGNIWRKVNERNVVMANRNTWANYQGNYTTPVFRKLAKRLDPIRKEVAKQKGACGAVVLVDGKAVGAEIFASEAYFKKIWPQLFNSYIIDAATNKEPVKLDVDKVGLLAKAYLAEMESAHVTEKRENDLVHLKIKSNGCLGKALVEGAKGRLVYFRFFPKPKEAGPDVRQLPTQQLNRRMAPSQIQLITPQQMQQPSPQTPIPRE